MELAFGSEWMEIEQNTKMEVNSKTLTRNDKDMDTVQRKHIYNQIINKNQPVETYWRKSVRDTISKCNLLYYRYR